MNRQSAFINAGRLLKGGLHCHTTRSDGAGMPEAVIRQHAENGYDFLALTDHRKYNYTNYDPESNIIIIPGMEFDNSFNDNGRRTFHIVCIGPSVEDGNGFSQDEVFKSGTALNQEDFQSYLDWLHDNKNLTIYCHPEWSSTPARYFEKMKGNFAMEIWNTGCAFENEMDTNAAYWDELLGQGIKIFGVATDDGHPVAQHCNGWVMVNAQNNINSILSSLEAGAFYSSCGPEIHDFYVDGDKAYVKCSGVSKILRISDCHPTDVRAGDNLTEAEFTLRGTYKYVRICVVDSNGKRAWTNPIFI